MKEKEIRTEVEGEAAAAAIPAVRKWAVVREVSMRILFAVAAAVFIAVVLVICVYLFVTAVPTISEIGWIDFLFGDRWLPSSDYYGVGTLVVGTACATAGALVVGVPIGLLVAVFMAFYCPKPVYRFLKPLTNILAGIPSIVYGYFGLQVIVPMVQQTFHAISGTTLLTTAIVLGIMIMPTIISITENSLRAVPKSYYEGTIALGATKERAIFRTIFPAAKSGVMTSIILGLGRAFGETAAVVFICGNSPQFPTSLLDPIRTLSSNIALEMGYARHLHREALIACAVVLFVFILLITVLVMLLRRKEK